MNTQSIHASHSMPVAALSALEAGIPALIVPLNLYLATFVMQVDFNEFFIALAMIASLLAALLLKPARDHTLVTMLGPFTLGVRIVIRWTAILGVLLAIGYATKLSEEFSRRAIVLWAMSTPVLLWCAELALNVLMKRLCMAEANVRTSVIAGFNDASEALADKLEKHP
ncbi:MAG: hypothetical protein PVF50_12755, partial [Gammaproteobacteria bacterium]